MPADDCFHLAGAHVLAIASATDQSSASGSVARPFARKSITRTASSGVGFHPFEPDEPDQLDLHLLTCEIAATLRQAR